MEDGIISFMLGSLFGLIPGYLIAKMFQRSGVKEMITEEANKYIQDLEFNNSYLEKKLSITTRERDIAIEDSKLTLKERNEALIMLSNKIK